MKSFKYILLLLGAAVLSSCSQDDIIAKDYVNFDVNNTNIEVPASGDGSVTVSIYSANNVSRDLVLDVNVVEESTTIDPSQYTVSPTAVIPAGTNVGSFDITLTGVDLTNNPAITLSFGEVDGLTLGEPTTFTVREECTGTEGFVLITFDDYSEETSWQVFQAGSTTPVASNSYAAGQTSTNERICILEPGNYLFVINDAFGDGMCCDFGEGSFQFILGDGTLVGSGGEFGSSESFEFTIN